MALSNSRRRQRGGGGLDAWPGYVDALSTLLMVIIFVLMVFVLAQGFLSVALSSRDRALDRLNRQVAELAELLSLERGQTGELRSALARAAENCVPPPRRATPSPPSSATCATSATGFRASAIPPAASATSSPPGYPTSNSPAAAPRSALPRWRRNWRMRCGGPRRPAAMPPRPPSG